MEVYLLVAEGPTDHVIISHLADEISNQVGKDIEIRLLEPKRDATGNCEPFGWSCIRGWCKEYRNKAPADVAKVTEELLKAPALRKNWRSLLVFAQAKGLIIQIDSDIAHHVNDIELFDAATTSKKQHVTKSLLGWINEASPGPELFLAVSSEAIETWLLATHSPEDPEFADLPANFDYEEIENFEERLINLGHKPTYLSKSKKRRLKKRPESYIKHAKVITRNLEDVRARCSSADDLCKYIS